MKKYGIILFIAGAVALVGWTLYKMWTTPSAKGGIDKTAVHSNVPGLTDSQLYEGVNLERG